jgi:hypothetical protein
MPAAQQQEGLAEDGAQRHRRDSAPTDGQAHRDILGLEAGEDYTTRCAYRHKQRQHRQVGAVQPPHFMIGMGTDSGADLGLLRQCVQVVRR